MGEKKKFSPCSAIAGILCLGAVVVMISALGEDVLFEVDVEREGTNGQIIDKVHCRWDRRTFEDGTEDQMYQDNAGNKEEETAGQMWLSMGIISTICGFFGTSFICILCIDRGTKHWFIASLVLTILAGAFALTAWGSSFYGWNDNTCAKNENSKVIFSVPAAFVAAFVFWISAILIAVDPNNRDGDSKEDSREPEQEEGPEKDSLFSLKTHQV